MVKSLIGEGCVPGDITFACMGGMVRHDVAHPDEGGDDQTYTRPPFVLHAYFKASRLCHEANVLLGILEGMEGMEKYGDVNGSSPDRKSVV